MKWPRYSKEQAWARSGKTRKMPTPKIKPPKPEFEDMSLFNETTRKLSEKEAELEVAHERIRNLEVALKAARGDKLRAVGASGYTTRDATRGTPAHDLNTLSEGDVTEMFKQHRQEAATKRKWWQLFRR